MIVKEIINAGLTRFYPVVVLRDQSVQNADQPSNEVILDRDDYSSMRLNEGLSDQEIFNFALTGMIAG
jgi:hypothetical protein